MIKVRVKATICCPYGSFKPGDEVALPTEMAEALLKSGAAEPVGKEAVEEGPKIAKAKKRPTKRTTAKRKAKVKSDDE